MKKVRCKMLLDIETTFDDDESTEETLLYCLKEDILEFIAFDLHDIKILEAQDEKIARYT